MQKNQRWIIIFPLAAAAIFTISSNLLGLAKQPAAVETPIITADTDITAGVSRPTRESLERSTREQP